MICPCVALCLAACRSMRRTAHTIIAPFYNQQRNMRRNRCRLASGRPQLRRRLVRALPLRRMGTATARPVRCTACPCTQAHQAWAWPGRGRRMAAPTRA